MKCVLLDYTECEPYLLLQCQQGMVPQLGSLLLHIPWSHPIDSSAWGCSATAHTLKNLIWAASWLVRQQNLPALALATLYALQ